jgi:hypothetical protein
VIKLVQGQELSTPQFVVLGKLFLWYNSGKTKRKFKKKLKRIQSAGFVKVEKNSKWEILIEKEEQGEVLQAHGAIVLV